MVSPLSNVGFEHAVQDPLLSGRKHEGDLLQLAHYQRMLEAIGLAAPSGRLAGIIGTERQVVWQDLDVPMWRTPSISETTKLRSTMERYDFEFHFRLDIIAVAQQHQIDPAVDLLVMPVRCGECPSCPWNDHCRPILETPPGDVSLLPRVGWAQWKAHRDRGVTNRAELAALDVRTAQLVAAKIDVATLMAAVAGRDPLTSVLELGDIWRKTKQLEQLYGSGIETVADVMSLDAATARYSTLAWLLWSNRSIWHERRLARLRCTERGVENIVVSRADVEVDIDMENVAEGVYLWGNLVRNRATGPVTPEYVPFVTWEDLIGDVEAQNSLAFWHWLMALRSATHANGLTFAAYCYNASAENAYLRRIGLSAGIEEEVEAFIDSDEWVDMMRVFNSQLIAGGRRGLKVTTPLAGFSWPVEDAGGGESMVMHDLAIVATTEVEQEAARTWLLIYNEGDVRATLALHEWMDRESGAIPPIDRVLPAKGWAHEEA